MKPDIYLTARQIRERYGKCSDMAIWRWLRDPTLGFPQPIVINARRLWKLSDLEAFEARRVSKSKAA